MLKITATWAEKCNRHPRYDPAAGESAIKGGCLRCLELSNLYLEVAVTIRDTGGKIVKPKRP